MKNSVELGRRRAVVVGATGLVGRELLRVLEAEPAYGEVLALARRARGTINAGGTKVREVMVDFEQLPPPLFRGDDLYCALGTTIRKAGSREAFRHVDHDYVLQCARLGAAGGMKRLLLVTALGADPDSAFFYNRVKGEVERAVEGAGFGEVHVFRPSLLLGERAERRPGEKLGALAAKAAAPLFLVPGLRRLAPVTGADVAEAMVRTALGPAAPGLRTHESDEIREISRRGTAGAGGS
ncbi:MAG: hypothetical protein IT285_03240 [Bdellovibrionales bacterium]|nr:hypothetical protein [Bdellovibrionales bacterium]